MSTLRAMEFAVWIGIAIAAWCAASIVVGFALAWLIGRGWMKAPHGRDLAGMGLIFRLD